ncbi:MAG: AraC family transcriptional regulator [Lachnospiraceae bacterium]|nr:AraC family transcriptional regulator [Lachnospiraceae bacterium]
MNNFDYEYYHEKKTHVKEDFPYNTYLCSIPLDFTRINTHWHEEVELIIIKKGCGKVSVALKQYTVKEGDIILVLPGQLHSINQLDENIMEYENILFKPQLLYGIGHDFCTSNYLRPIFEDKFTFDAHINPELEYYNKLYSYIDDIDTLRSQPVFGYELGIKGDLFSFFTILFFHHIDANTPKSINKHAIKLKEILHFISGAYNQPLTPKDAADAVGFSTSHFMKIFKQHMDCTFTEYLNDYRLSIAETLLTSTDKSILDISYEIGFTNLSYFNRLFKRKYGISPREYRKSFY